MSKVSISLNSIRKRMKENPGTIVVKSNFYGLGYPALMYLESVCNEIAVLDFKELNTVVSYIGNGKRYLILYPDFKENTCNQWKDFSDVSFCIMNHKQLQKVGVDGYPDASQCYLRVDEFLGMHGFLMSEILTMKDIDNFKGIFLHLNERITTKDTENIDVLYDFVKKKKLELNIGGSVALEYLKNRKWDYDKIRVRYAGELFRKNQNGFFTLEARILNQNILNKETRIGYYSDIKTYCYGTLVLLDIGYGEWPLVTKLYDYSVELRCNDISFSIPVYPCMNTMWLYCKEEVKLHDTVTFFNEIQEIEKICNILQIDLDEFYTSFDSNLCREYNV